MQVKLRTRLVAPHHRLAVVALALCGGCGLIFKQTIPMPQPNVALPHGLAAPLRMKLADGIPDTMRVVDKQFDYRDHDYLHWRQTLQDAFNQAFGDANPTQSTVPAQILEITRTSGEFYYPPTRNTVAVALTYKARLLDANGQVIQVSARTANSKHGYSGMQEAFAYATQSAIESMFEEMAADLFGAKTTAAAQP
jgi:hypothetical protein